MAEPTNAPPATKKGFAIPTWAIVVGTVALGAGGFLWWRGRKNAQAAASSTATGAPPVVDTSGLATDQAEALYAQIRDIQGQESTTLQNVQGVSGQVTGVSQQVSNIPSGPAGAPGPAGPPGPTGPAPTPPPAPKPTSTPHYNLTWHTIPGHPVTLSQLAQWNHSSVAGIIAQTRIGEATDTSSPRSKLKQYLDRGNWNAIIPPGYTLYIPV